jgi:hypothetical protein
MDLSLNNTIFISVTFAGGILSGPILSSKPMSKITETLSLSEEDLFRG